MFWLIIIGFPVALVFVVYLSTYVDAQQRASGWGSSVAGDTPYEPYCEQTWLNESRIKVIVLAVIFVVAFIRIMIFGVSDEPYIANNPTWSW